jgi:hypothetical protein
MVPCAWFDGRRKEGLSRQRDTTRKTSGLCWLTKRSVLSLHQILPERRHALLNLCQLSQSNQIRAPGTPVETSPQGYRTRRFCTTLERHCAEYRPQRSRRDSCTEHARTTPVSLLQDSWWLSSRQRHIGHVKITSVPEIHKP